MTIRSSALLLWTALLLTCGMSAAEPLRKSAEKSDVEVPQKAKSKEPKKPGKQDSPDVKPEKEKDVKEPTPKSQKQTQSVTPAVTNGPTTPSISSSLSPLRFGSYSLPPAIMGEKRLLTFEFGQDRLQLTRTQLLSLPSTTLVTQHIQLGRTFTYQGVLLRTLASAMHASGQDLRVYASNGFVATIAAEDYLKAPIMLAYASNGKPISILDKGPLTIVMPANDPRFRHKGFYWVWFVERITPVPPV